jgi:hypothetical protein
MRFFFVLLMPMDAGCDADVRKQRARWYDNGAAASLAWDLRHTETARPRGWRSLASARPS